VRDHAFHPVRVARVVAETADASSFVLDVPDGFTYEAGQFCTFRFSIDGAAHARCYSMASAPAVDDDLFVTVKRVPGGVVSNWMLDQISEGDMVDVTFPAGVFRLAGEGEVVAYAGGSGITPLLSLVKTALATTTRSVRLLYANRDRDSVIFASVLDDLSAAYGDRLHVEYRFDVEHGFCDDADIATFVTDAASDAEHYLCGPPPFMDIVEAALLQRGVEERRIHVERFTPLQPVMAAEPEPDAGEATKVTIELDGRTETTDHHPGTTILQTARSIGLSPPYSCESGSCATCMATLKEGEVSMFVNDVLTDEEVADGLILTCQSVPTTPTVHVVYE